MLSHCWSPRCRREIYIIRPNHSYHGRERVSDTPAPKKSRGPVHHPNTPRYSSAYNMWKPQGYRSHHIMCRTHQTAPLLGTRYDTIPNTRCHELPGKTADQSSISYILESISNISNPQINSFLRMQITNHIQTTKNQIRYNRGDSSRKSDIMLEWKGNLDQYCCNNQTISILSTALLP